MIVPVIEHMEKMNSRSSSNTSSTTTTRLLNTNLNDNNKTNHQETFSNQDNNNLVTSQHNSNLVNKEIQHDGRIRKNSIQDVEMLNDINNNELSKHIINEDKNLTNLNQTIIIEGGLNGLQFQLKPELNQNRHITLKVVPISNDNSTSSNTSSSSSILKTTNHQTLLLNGSEHQTNYNTIEKNENLNHPQTTTVNLSESNQNVYFMMQTPIDLLTSTNMTNSKLKTSIPAQVSPMHQTTQLSTLTLQNIPNTQNISTGFNQTILPNTTTVTLSSPISSSSSLNSSPTPPKVIRDERRRANHNEVERRRRDNINKWIVELSKVIPDCSNDQSKHGQSKGGILEKTVQYLMDVKKANQHLNDQLRLLDKLKQENELLKQQNENFKKENQILKLKLGIDTGDNKQQQQQLIPTSSNSNASTSTT